MICNLRHLEIVDMKDIEISCNIHPQALLFSLPIKVSCQSKACRVLVADTGKLRVNTCLRDPH